MRYLKYLVVCLFVFFPLYVQGLEATLGMDCDKSLLSANESTNCTIKMNVQSGGVKSFSGVFLVSSNLEIKDIVASSIWIDSSSANQMTLKSDVIQTGNIEIAQVIVTAKSVVPATNETIQLTNIQATDENESNVNYEDVSKLIRIPSNNASLQSLTISSGNLSPVFNPDVTSYTVSDVTSGQINIQATGYDGASITGIGTKALQYGENEFKITVKAESGTTKTYTLNIFRKDERSSDNSLKSITVKNGTLDDNNRVVFPSTVDTFTVDAIPNDSKAIVSYSSNNVSLSLDETYTIYIYVIAENGQKATYSVTATRKDERSDNNYLKSLKINNQNISLSFLQSYTKTVDYDVTTADITAEAEDSKAKVSVTGSKKLKVGSNTFTIVVTAENESIRTYKLIVIRKNNQGDITDLSNNSSLKSLKIKNLDFSFEKEQLEYNLEVENNISSIKIQYEVEDSKATVVMDGDTDLKVGLNTIRIVVTAENGETTTYVLKITRKAKRTEVDNKEDSIISALNDKLDYEQVVVKVNSQDNLVISKTVLQTALEVKKRITYQVLENNLIQYSLILDGNLLKDTELDFSYRILFEEPNETIHNAFGTSKNIIFTFEKQESFPKGITYQIYVGDTFNKGSSLYLYSYQQEDNKIKLIKENIQVIDNYVTIPFEQNSIYVLAGEKLVESNPQPVDTEPTKNIFPYVIGGTVISVVIILVVILIIISKNKKKNNSKEKNKQDSTEVNSVPVTEVASISDVKEEATVPISSESLETVPVVEDTIDIDLIDIEEPSHNHMQFLFGISVMDIKDYLDKCPLADLKNSNITNGIVIISFENDSLLLKNGLQKGDVLVDFNNQQIVNKSQFKDLITNVTKGQVVEFVYYRNGENKKVKVLIS